MDSPACGKIEARLLPARHEFDDEAYLQLHDDVREAYRKGIVGSGWHHFELHGAAEGRKWIPRKNRLHAVIREIAPGDEMFTGNEVQYFDAGLSALQCIEATLLIARLQEASIRTILDLPCGHGRVMRFLHRAFPQAEITACDINRDGVEFCARQFGANPIISDSNPARIALPKGSYDLIWCGSLLTHVCLADCHAFLDLFSHVLRPDGIVLFTMHGRKSEQEFATGKNHFGLTGPQIVRILEEYRQHGFAYADYVDRPGYGISMSSPGFVVSQLIRTENWRLLGYHEDGWDRRQDAIALQRI